MSEAPAPVLAGPDLAPLRNRLAALLGRGRPLTGTTTLKGLSAEERRATELLIGRGPAFGDPGRPLRIDLDRLAVDLGGAARSLRHALEAVEGPIENHAAATERLAGDWAHVINSAAPTLRLGEHPLGPWLRAPGTAGLLKRLAREPATAATLLADLARLTADLPRPATQLSVFAATHLGNAHALDQNQPLRTLLASALAHAREAGRLPEAAPEATALQAGGLFRSPLTRTVLALNLPAASAAAAASGSVRDRWLATSLRHHAAAGEPVALTLRQLAGVSPAAFAALAGQTVFTCENPAVVAAAADALGPASRPLVCVSGQPASAALGLLRLLASAGATLRHHGDFDPAGLLIAARLHRALGVGSWRFDEADYHHARRSAVATGWPDNRPPPPTPWSPGLAPALAEHRQAIHEESLLPLLLQDLRPA